MSVSYRDLGKPDELMEDRAIDLQKVKGRTVFLFLASLAACEISRARNQAHVQQ